MPQREQRHLLRLLPEVLVLLLVSAAFATYGLDLSGKVFGVSTTPDAVPPPEGIVLPAQASAEPVASAVVPVPVDPAAVRRALAPLVGDPRLGTHAVVMVRDLSSGEIVYRHGAGAFVPASTLKILTGAAALEELGGSTRFHTTVRVTGQRVWLVGGGDPYLMSSPQAAKGLYPARGDLDTLASRTAAALKARGLDVVRLAYDDTLFTGPRVNPAWPATYVPENVVPPITALWADQGLGGDGRYVADPPATAAGLFVKALARRGIRVEGPVRAEQVPAAATEVARIASAPVSEIVEHTLDVSDNNAAEVLAHHVGLARGQGASFAGGARAVSQVLDGLGVPLTGATILDGSGLSRKNRLTAPALLGLLGLAASAEGAELRPVITGIPVAGFTGSLQDRFDQGPAEALGRVRAKTGTLTGVHGLAGVVSGADGSRLAFVAITDRVVGDGNQLPARTAVDRIAAALGACRCAAGT